LLVASIKILRDLEAAFVFRLRSGQPNPLGAFIHGKHRNVIMNLLLFMLEIFVIVTAIALVPARSELRNSRSRLIHNERQQDNSLRF
jgi:hypothetical protein